MIILIQLLFRNYIFKAEFQIKFC